MSLWPDWYDAEGFARKTPYDCPCGESHENFRYIRGLLSGARSKGWWYCMACQRRIEPNAIQGFLTPEQKEKLQALKLYFSNEGMGDLHAREEVIACALPEAMLD